MHARKRYPTIAGASLLAALLISCGGLPRSLREDIASERDKLPQAQRQLETSRQTVRDDMAHSPDLFAGTPAATAWPARLDSDQSQLNHAKADLQELQKLGARDRARATQLLREERDLREAVLRDSEAVESEADSWLDFQRNIPHYLATMQREYDDIHAIDLSPVSKTVQKAGEDWPAKKDELDERLARLRESSTDADMLWSATASARQDAAAGQATGPEVATLIQANQKLASEESGISHGADELRASCGQLYNAWDKILVDLDKSHRGFDTEYSEKIKIVNTHFTEVALKQTEVSSDERWVNVSPSAYRAVESDLGMAISHKDAGRFDSEAVNTAQPPGFAYIAPPSQGSNQYGYWSHSGGNSVWTFLPEYLIMRELLWGHSYRPVVVNEYYGYQTAQRAGRSYYGRETPASPPKYGSQGTFTAQRYAGSRYVQSGGFKGSAYASNRESGAFGHSETPGFSHAEPHASGSSAGQKFGSNSGGKSFGSHSSSHSAGRTFGHRR